MGGLPDFCTEKIMDAGEQPQISERDVVRQRWLRRIGICILAAGLASSVLIRQWTPPDDGAEELVQDGTLLSGNAKRQANEMKDLGGQANVIAGEASDWFLSLWHGRRLATTLAVLSLGGAAACFALAQLLNYPPPPESPAGGPGREKKR
jgi:hypothetical protein